MSEKVLYIGLVAFAIGLVFRFAALPRWLKGSLMVLPFAAIIADILAWFLTKWDPVYAYTVVTAGAVLGLAWGGADPDLALPAVVLAGARCGVRPPMRKAEITPMTLKPTVRAPSPRLGLQRFGQSGPRDLRGVRR
ncbi:MAG TPA: hypothetical protein VIH11_06740 [Gemmatimonadaceae bacterium]